LVIRSGRWVGRREKEVVRMHTLIYFEDASMPPEIFTDAAVARKRFDELADNWNCRLFVEQAEAYGDVEGNLLGAALDVCERLNSDFKSLERSYGGGLYATGAGYVLKPRVLELRDVLAKAGRL
jgi:hypothetical protein